MKKLLLSILLGAISIQGALADERPNTFGVVLEPYPVDTESPAAGVDEIHKPRIGLEYARIVTRHLDLTLAAGYHQIDTKSSTAATVTDSLFDVRVGGRLFLFDRTVSWSPFAGGAFSRGWLQDSTSTTGGKLSYTGWNAQLGLGRQFSESTEFRVTLGYTRMEADEPRGNHLDDLSTADLGFALATRF